LLDTNLPPYGLSRIPSLGKVIIDDSFESIYLNIYPSQKMPEDGAGPVLTRGSGSDFSSNDQDHELLADLGDYMQVRCNVMISFIPTVFVKTIEKTSPD
jgi:hypothetical protein